MPNGKPNILALMGDDIGWFNISHNNRGMMGYQTPNIDMLPYLTGETDKCPRNWFFYVDDDGQLTAIRIGDWKIVYFEQRAKTMQLWAEPFVELRFPKIFNLRRDPFERADENSNTYWDWVLRHVFVFYGGVALTKQQLQTFAEFPQRQKPGAFNLERIIETTLKAIDGSHH